MKKSRFILIVLLFLIGYPSKTISASARNTSILPVATPTPYSRTFEVQTISRDTVCRERRLVATGVRLRFENGAHLIQGGGCILTFAGFGLEKPDSLEAFFSGFGPGDIVWKGSEYPSTVTTSLWADTDLSDKLNRAIAALAGRQNVTIKAYPGNFGSPWQLKSGQNLYLTEGRYTNSVDLRDGIEFYIESNASVYGDGKDRTILQESSRGNRNTRMFAGSGFKDGPFAGYNEKINFHDFAIEGHASQSFFDNGPTTIHLGNCTDCHAIKIRLKDTHAYGIYVGGFHSLGFTAKNSSIEYCEFDHVIAQNSGALNGINIRIVHNKYWNLGKLATDPLSNAVDVEPNVADEITQNITVCDNEISGTGGQYWNGVIVQIGGSKLPVDGGEVCRNKITGPGLLNGLMIAGTNGLRVHDNYVRTALQSGAYLNGNTSLSFTANMLIDVAPGGIYAVRVENTTGSTFTNNSVTKTSLGNDNRFVEIGTSGNNIYSGNKRGGVVLLRGSREASHQ